MEFLGQLSLTQRSSNIRQKLTFCWASLVAQLVKNLCAMQETWVRSLSWEDPLEKEMATTPVLLPAVHGVTRVRHDLATKPLPTTFC